jgi:hypothetical protein
VNPNGCIYHAEHPDRAYCEVFSGVAEAVSDSPIQLVDAIVEASAHLPMQTVHTHSSMQCMHRTVHIRRQKILPKNKPVALAPVLATSANKYCISVRQNCIRNKSAVRTALSVTRVPTFFAEGYLSNLSKNSIAQRASAKFAAVLQHDLLRIVQSHLQ